MAIQEARWDLRIWVRLCDGYLLGFSSLRRSHGGSTTCLYALHRVNKRRFRCFAERCEDAIEDARVVMFVQPALTKKGENRRSARTPLHDSLGRHFGHRSSGIAAPVFRRFSLACRYQYAVWWNQACRRGRWSPSRSPRRDLCTTCCADDRNHDCTRRAWEGRKAQGHPFR